MRKSCVHQIQPKHSYVVNLKAVVDTFNQEKALVGTIQSYHKHYFPVNQMLAVEAECQ